MKRAFKLISLAIIVTNCQRVSPEQLHKKLVNESFILVNRNNDSIEIEFAEDCVKTFNWDFFTYEAWEVKDNMGATILFFDGRYFELVEILEGKIRFTDVVNDSIHFELIKASEKSINEGEIVGAWIDEGYYHWLSDDFIPPPPCSFSDTDTFLIPSIEFYKDSCIHTLACSKERMPIRVNENFGIIEFGRFCNTRHQWKVRSLKEDTITFDIRYVEDHEIRYIDSKRYIKAPAVKE